MPNWVTTLCLHWVHGNGNNFTIIATMVAGRRRRRSCRNQPAYRVYQVSLAPTVAAHIHTHTRAHTESAASPTQAPDGRDSMARRCHVWSRTMEFEFKRRMLPTGDLPANQPTPGLPGVRVRVLVCVCVWLVARFARWIDAHASVVLMPGPRSTGTG